MSFVTSLSRWLLYLLGVGAVVWSISVARFFDIESDLFNTATMIRRGNTFSPAMATAAKAQLAADRPYMRGSMLPYGEIIGLMVLERLLTAGNDDRATQLAAIDFERLTKENLRRNPTDGFSWLALFWLATLDGKEPSTDAYHYLRLSYRFAPNEGWIAERRNPQVLRYFPELPADIASQAKAEFAHLVRSFLYSKAAEILEAAPPTARQFLLSQLDELSEEQRKIFASAMRERKPVDERERVAPAERPWQ